MSNKIEPKCIECQKTETLLWRPAEHGGEICQECYEQKEHILVESHITTMDSDRLIEELKIKAQKDVADGKTTVTAEEKKIRKSTRSTRFKTKGSNQSINTPTLSFHSQSLCNNSKIQSRSRSRRNIFKKNPLKTPITQATTHVVESVFYKESYLQVGDIVSVVDEMQNIYYAQIRGLLVDNYSEKSAYLTWLIPTQASPEPRDGFDPASYLIDIISGPDEELSRKLSALEFIMHAPSNYYHDRTTPFPLPDAMENDGKTKGFIWTTLSEFQRASDT